LPKSLPAGPHDVGDVTLVEPGGPRWLELRTDDELQRLFEEQRGSTVTTPLAVESCLLEMARRKSERWRKFLATEWKQRAAGGPAEHALLTALRRAHGKQDPLALDWVGAPPFTAAFHRRVSGGADDPVLAEERGWREGELHSHPGR